MNRKDMIIVAALINAGLLIVLFISAVKTRRIEEQSFEPADKMPIAQVETSAIKRAEPLQRRDQIDQVISEYSAKVSKEREEKPKVLSLPVDAL